MNEELCTSCMACYSTCPRSAITIEKDSFGFYYPAVNKELCNNCGLCKKICPINNASNKSSLKEVWACTNKDETVRFSSSSGGIFSLLAEQIISQCGYVCGVIYDNTTGFVKHVLSNNLDDIKRMRGSKYVQSYIGNCYKEIKQLLDKNIPVLFSGTPCQVDGLKSFLQKDYKTLVTIDLLCNSIIPPDILDEYIRNITGNNYKHLYINMRDKNTGWQNFNFYIEWTNNNDVTKRFSAFQGDSPFFLAFLNHICIKDSCINCKYKTPERYSDITLGDFWRIDNIDNTINDDKGLSICSINTQEGKELFEKINNKMHICKQIDYNLALNTQTSLTGLNHQHKNRDKFFQYAPYVASKINLINDLLGNNIVKIITFQFAENYGAMLQCWALCETIKNFGFTPQVIKYAPHYYKTLGKEYNIFTRFRNAKIPLTEICYSQKDFEAQLANCNKVIVGGDVTFREWPNDKTYPRYRFLGDWVSGKRTIASYSSSFRSLDLHCDESSANRLKDLFQRFDKIGVREQSGVKILKNTFNINATEVLDSVFLPDKSLYDNLIDNKKLPMPDGKYIAFCVLGRCNMQKEMFGYRIIDISKPKYIIEQWLNYIKYSKFVITDSFHALCFAIIFKKPFIAINRRLFGGSEDRIINLLNNLNLLSRYKNSLQDISGEDFIDNINWEEVDKIITTRKKDSLRFLLDILLLNPKNKEKYCNNEIEIFRAATEIEYENNKMRDMCGLF